MIPALIAGGAALAGAIGSIYNNERNLNYQQNTQSYMQGMQREAWEREDTAVQRRVSDLEAAGLSPVLAAGAPAASSSPISINPLKSEDALGTQGAIQGMEALNRYAQTASNLQTAESQRSLMEAQERMYDAKAENTNVDTAIKGVDYKYYEPAGKWPRQKDDILNTIIKYMPQMMKARGQIRPNATSQGKPVDRRGAVDYKEGQLVPEFNYWGIFDQK